MSQQLELFNDTPFALRVAFPDALRIFRQNYWDHLPFGKNSDAICRKLLDFFGSHHLDSISKADVERMRRFFLEMGYSVSYVNKIHMTGSRLINKWFEYREGRFIGGVDLSRVVLPSKNPFSLVPRPNEKQFARKLEITKQRKQLLCSVADPDFSEILDGLWWTMLRQGDFFSFTAANVNIDQKTITGIQSKSITTKKPGGLPYKVTIPTDRLGVIMGRIANTKPGTPLFRRVNIQKRWEETRRKAAHFDPELAKAQMRDFRGGATSYLLGFADVETVRKKGGWASTEMIPHYDKRGDELVLRATEKLVEA